MSSKQNTTESSKNHLFDPPKIESEYSEKFIQFFHVDLISKAGPLKRIKPAELIESQWWCALETPEGFAETPCKNKPGTSRRNTLRGATGMVLTGERLELLISSASLIS